MEHAQKIEEEESVLQGKETVQGKTMTHSASHGMFRGWQEHRYMVREFSMLMKGGVMKSPACPPHGVRLSVQGLQLPRFKSQLPYLLACENSVILLPSLGLSFSICKVGGKEECLLHRIKETFYVEHSI